LKYTILGLGFLSILSLLIIPVSQNNDNVGPTFYGMFTLVSYDADGNEKFSQTIHNRLVDTGENFMLFQTFQNATAVNAANVNIGSICVTDATVVVAETENAADFDGDNSITETNCQEDVTVTISGSTAVIGPITFTAGTHLANDDTVKGIAICQNDSTDDGAFNNCATEGIMFAVVDTSDVTVGSGETVDITYTFDLTSASD